MADELADILWFSQQLSKLKYTYRYSATRCEDKDSAAAHSWQLAFMAYTFQHKLSLNINVERAIKLALVHDIAESVTGDIDYRLVKDGKVSAQDKRVAEEKAIGELTNGLPKELRDEIYNLWMEYENSSSEEARYIKALDKLESFTNILERGHPAFDHADIIATRADKAVQDYPALKPVLRSIKQELRQRFLKLGIPWKPEFNYALEE